MKKHNGTLAYLAVGLVCAAVGLGGAPLNAAELSQYSFELSSGTSISAAAATRTQPQPAGSLAERVARMEHVLDGGMLVAMQSRLDDLQIIRDGVEVQRYDVGTLRQHQRKLSLDVDRHLRDLEIGKTAEVSAKNEGNLAPSLPNAAPRLPNAAPQLPNATPRLPNATPQLPNAIPRLPNATPRLPNATPRLPNITPPMSGTNPRVPAFQPPLGTPSAGAADGGQARVAYEQAFNMLRAAQYGPAIVAFKQFLNNYPQGPLADNAQYGLGEAEYHARQFPAALKDFRKVVGRYPDSPKVPDAQLKIGFTYYEMGQWSKARKALNDVMQQYPGSSAAKLAENRLQKMHVEGH